MTFRLPSLRALRAFEAASRHLSFTRAAHELNVTQAAISHQIKGLEARLGMPLFRRLNRALLLTEAGQSLFLAVNEALELIATAVDRLHRHDQTGEVTVTTMDSFAATWLVPRLGRFRKLHPEIDIRITTSDVSIDFARETVDLGVRYGYGDWPGLHVEKLMTEELFPVCSPALLETGPPMNKASDLSRYTLLHDDMRIDWRMWLMAAGVEDIVNSDRGPSFGHSNLVIQAAIHGDGVALARSVLVATSLAEGQLIKPFELALPTNYAYYVVCPEVNLQRPKIKAFRQWLFQEAAKEENATV